MSLINPCSKIVVRMRESHGYAMMFKPGWFIRPLGGFGIEGIEGEAVELACAHWGNITAGVDVHAEIHLHNGAPFVWLYVMVPLASVGSIIVVPDVVMAVTA